MIISRTPFRISFFGGGTDYPVWFKKNGGAVLSTTIDKYCYVTCRHLPQFFAHKTRIVWSKIELVNKVREIEHPSSRAILSYLKMHDGLEIHHNADLPARSGLGASSSFAVGLLNALYALQGKMMSKEQLAREAIHIERNILKENVGSQDQAAAAHGGFNKIEFENSHGIRVTPMTIAARKRADLQDHLMLVFTGFTRSASEIAAEQIRNTTRHGGELARMRSMVDEAIAILNGKRTPLDDFGRLLHESWTLKRSLSSKISTDAIDAIYDKARKNGAIGGKLLGAGGGGFMLFYAPPDAQPKIKKHLNGFLHVPFAFENSGSQIIYHATS